MPTPAVDTLHFVNVPCREQMPHFERTYETAGPDLAVIAINAGFNESLDDVRTYRDKLAITMPIVLADARLDAALVAARAPPGDSAANIAASLMNPADISRYKVGTRALGKLPPHCARPPTRHDRSLAHLWPSARLQCQRQSHAGVAAAPLDQQQWLAIGRLKAAAPASEEITERIPEFRTLSASFS